MIQALIGTKKNMTSTYDARGRRVGATILEVLPNSVTQIKNQDSKDGYNAVQVAYGTKKSTKKPQIGHAKKAGFDQKVRWFREVRIQSEEIKMRNTDQPLKIDLENMKPGQQITVNQVFSVGDIVKVTGTSKGKGFAGGVKRHGFAGGPKTHGQSDRHRAPGSIGSGTTPGRVYKGKKMAGHMGSATASVLNLEIVKIDRKNGLLTVKGGVPGPVGGELLITKLGRVKGYTPPPEEKLDEEELEAEDKSSEVTHPSAEGETKIEDTVVEQEVTNEEVKEQENAG